MVIKQTIHKVRNGFTDFRRGFSIVFGKPEPGEGDRKLAKISILVMGQIPVYGKDTVKVQVIKGIDGDLKRAMKKGGKDAVEKLIQNAITTPEYMRLLYKLGMSESDIRVLSMEVMKRYAK